MERKEAIKLAKRISREHECVQHVNHSIWQGECNGYYVSDWYETSTIISFENGVKL